MESNQPENGVVPNDEEWSLPHEGVLIWKDGEFVWEHDQPIVSDDDIEETEKPA